MGKQKQKKRNHRSASTIPSPGKSTLQSCAQAVFRERSAQFQKNSSAISTVYEGLDLDTVRVKRRISAAVSVAEEVKARYAEICPDIPNRFTLAEDWITMNAYPVSAYDYVEKYVFSTLGAAIWILDHLRDNGKTDQLRELLRTAPPPGDVLMPDVWDPCHSRQALTQMVAIINNRNQDCAAAEKSVRKNKSAVSRVYMDRPTAEQKIDHSVPSRRLYEQVIGLIAPDALAALVETYQEKYWDWLRRYFRSRAEFMQEELSLRAEIEAFQNQLQTLTTQKQALPLANPFSKDRIPSFDGKMQESQYFHAKAMEHQNIVLFDKQEEFNFRFRSFTRDVGDFTLMPKERISEQFGEAIADIWAGFEMDEPYSMCMAFLLLVDHGSDLPWCYFPGVNLQSCYASMLPWTRTKFISACDDIWEHFDPESGNVIPGPSGQPLPRKIKVPDADNWYRMQYHDSAKTDTDSNDLYSLSHILYEVTGCIMPRRLDRYHAALNTLNRYGINSKKENRNLLYCMALLGEARHQTLISQSPASRSDTFDGMPESVEELQEQVTLLKEELSQYKQALQNASAEIKAEKDRNAQLQNRLTHRDLELQDLRNILFGIEDASFSLGIKFPYRTASQIVVFSGDPSWVGKMKAQLPDVLFFLQVSKGNPNALRTADTIWIQPRDLPYREYQRIIAQAETFDTPIRIFPSTDVSACAALLARADISSC